MIKPKFSWRDLFNALLRRKPFEIKGEFIMCPVQNYVAQMQEFNTKNPSIKVLEEIKTVFMGMADVPDAQLIGRTKQVQMPMVAALIIYKTHAKPETKSEPMFNVDDVKAVEKHTHHAFRNMIK